MSNLRSKIIRLAHEKPEYREHLLPLVQKTARKVPTKDIKLLEKMTDYNDHTGALILIAKLVGDKKQVETLEHISALHKIYGSMVQPLITLRNYSRDQLYKAASKVRYDDGSTLYDHIP